MSKTYIFAPDLHFPLVHWPSWNALMDFINKNPIAGLVFGGDQFDNQEVSPHTRGKHLLREGKRLARHAEAFDKLILTPLDKVLGKAEKIWISGNHDHWLTQYIEEHPEVEGSLEQHKILNIEKRGWKFIECGKAFKKGKLTFLHGDTLSGIGNQVSGIPAKKALDAYATNVLFGHFHTLQTFTRLMPQDQTQKWTATCSPILGATNPSYLRNRPTAWLNGFTIVEFQDNGAFNMYPIVVLKGKFSYGGKTYGR
jgi:UDP-2,3-diacylglucosamine pyrophosphatase LpxH